MDRGDFTEITIVGGTPSPGGPCVAVASTMTWRRAEDEGLAAFQARVRAEARKLGVDRILWTSTPEKEST